MDLKDMTILRALYGLAVAFYLVDVSTMVYRITSMSADLSNKESQLKAIKFQLEKKMNASQYEVEAAEESLTFLTKKVYTFFAHETNWTNAVALCANKRMVLAAPKTKKLLRFVSNEANKTIPNYHWWVAVSYDRHMDASNFVWMDGEKLDIQSYLWRKSPEEPNEYKNQSVANSCGSVFLGELVDDPCIKERGFICEIPGKQETSEMIGNLDDVHHDLYDDF
ncbi:uncharacterized protein LOC132194271 [Neocloeon triangulifer]|uniref:uncharacterized protein LOC132194271 n=1 Tax=Neocloeon triangulifer TaxID=2078957 RepID=UPI00286F1F1F|nr:uncharacterized protein LOC132194271 [Neocloeon triangulifer]